MLRVEHALLMGTETDRIEHLCKAVSKAHQKRLFVCVDYVRKTAGEEVRLALPNHVYRLMTVGSRSL